MKGKMFLRTGVVIVMVAALVGLAIAAAAQDKAADNMQILREKIKADKKLLVASNMELTESEAKGFWPVYEGYQKELTGINQRIAKLIESYAADYRAKSLTNEKAKKLVEELIAVEKAEAAMKVNYAPQTGQSIAPSESGALPANRKQDPGPNKVRTCGGGAARPIARAGIFSNSFALTGEGQGEGREKGKFLDFPILDHPHPNPPPSEGEGNPILKNRGMEIR